MRAGAKSVLNEQQYGNGDSALEDDPNQYFFDNSSQNGSRTMEDRKRIHQAREKNIGLETLKGFLGSDPAQYGLDRKGQERIAAQLLEQIEDQNKLVDLDDDQDVQKREKSLIQQLNEFDQMPIHSYLQQTTGMQDPKHLLGTMAQQDRAKQRFQRKMEGLTALYEEQHQTQDKYDANDDGHGDDMKYDDNDDDNDDEGEYEDVAVSDEQLQTLLAKFKPTVGPNGELIFDDIDFDGPGDAIASSSNRKKKNVLGVDGNEEEDENVQESFDQYHNALADDPTVFKYIDDDYEYFIPPGMSVQKLVQMDLPAQEVINYVRKQITEGQLQTNYMGISLQSLTKRLQLENHKRKQQGLEQIELQEYKPTTFDSLDLTGFPQQDVQDLKEYYSHFEQFRKLKSLEKMKDNPAYDPDDPDWVDDDGPKISKRQLKKLAKTNPELAKTITPKSGKSVYLTDIESNPNLTPEQRKLLIKKYSPQMMDDDNNDENVDLFDYDEQLEYERHEAKRTEQIESGNAFERALQYPDHKPTIKALQTFVRTVPMDEPIPKELQRRVNLLLNDADYRKLKDYHYMMNDVEIWYLANRLPVVYSIMRRILIEIRQRIPTWRPERVLEFAAGASPALWAVRDIYYQDVAEYTAVERDGRLALLGQQLTADLGIHIYYRSRLLVNDDGHMEVSKDDQLKREKKRARLTHKQRKIMDKEDKIRKEQQLAEMSKKHTLVMSPYALSKQPNKEYRRLLLEALWDQVDPNGGVLVIIESTEADSSGFNVIRECRDYLLRKYPKNVAIQEEKINDIGKADEDIITPIVQVEENIKQEDGDVPAWAQGATKKVSTDEQSSRVKKPQQPAASSILPCSHDRPCPMGAMMKLNEEVKKLKSLAREEQLSISLPQVPIKSCMFGQRMLRAPMPNQSPLQDLDIPQFLGDAIIENFSYIVLRRGEIPTVKEDELEVKPYESSVVPKGKLNLPGGLTREEYLELKAFEREQIAKEDAENVQKQREKQKEADERAELGDFIDDDEDGALEFDLLVQNNNNEDDLRNVNNLNDIEARRLAMGVFGAKSIDNQETLERHTETMIGKLHKKNSPQTISTTTTTTTTTTKPKTKYEENDMATAEELDDPPRDILEDYDLDIIQKELGYELDEEALQTLREVIAESARDRPLINPKREFNLNRWSRVLSPPLKRGGHVVMDLCTPDGNFERRIVGREGVGGLGFKQARLMNWGDIWPYKRPMTLRELKAERELQNSADSNTFNNVTSSLEAKETLKELRNLFGVAYTPDSIKNIEHFKDKFTPEDNDDAEPVSLDQLNFDNMDAGFTGKLTEQLAVAKGLRELHEERYKQSQREKRKDNTPNEFREMNIFNDPSFYEAFPGIDGLDIDNLPEGTPGTQKIGGRVVLVDDTREASFQAELKAQKLVEDLKALPQEQQAALGGDVQAALKSLGKRGQSLGGNDYLTQLNQESYVPESQLKQETSLMNKLRQKAQNDEAYVKLAVQKEFADDLTDYGEETGLPPGFEGLNELKQPTQVPTTLSKGVRVDDIISNVEQRIIAIKEDKKERQKMNKKQQQIAEKQYQKELKALGLSPAQIAEKLKAKRGEEAPPERTQDNMRDDFMKLMSHNVEFDESIASYHQIRQQQEAELKQLRTQKNDNGDGDDDDDDDASYDEHDEGKSDYTDGEILHIPGQGAPSHSFIPTPTDLDFSTSKPNLWQSGNTQAGRDALRSKLLDVLSSQQTDELKSFLDDPALKTSSNRKAKEMSKDAKKKGGVDGEKLSRAERLKHERMRREFLFSDDDEWDLNANDGVEEAPISQAKAAMELHDEETGGKKTKSVHSIHGAALDVVDHSYRVLPTRTKNQLGVPLTGKRSFAEDMDLLEKERGGGGDDISYVDVSQNRQRVPKDIHGYRKGNSSHTTAPSSVKSRPFNKLNKRKMSTFRSTTPSLFSAPVNPSRQAQKQATLLTMPGQTGPKRTTDTKIVQIGSGFKHQKLHPNRQVYLQALNVDTRGPAIHHTSIYNTILTKNPTSDLTATERSVPIKQSSAGALSKDNRDQASNVGVHGFFRYDGSLPMGSFGMAKSRDMARKLQELAGIDEDPSQPSIPKLPPTPGVESPFNDESAPPMSLDHGEDAINAQHTRQVFGQDIYIYEEDLIKKRHSSEHDEISGLLYRPKAAEDRESLEIKAEMDPEGDDLETYGRDIYAHSMDRSQTRHDQFGQEVSGKLGSQGPSKTAIDHFRNEDRERRRKLESRKKRTEFSQRVDMARQILAGNDVREYTANLTTPKKKIINLKTAHLGGDPATMAGTQPFFRERLSSIQQEIDEVKKLRRDRQRKMLTPLALSDELPRDAEGNLLASLKIKPDLHAKTMTQKRASLAVLEQPEEADVRHMRESKGLDYSYTALLTNIDGFGPKMDDLGRYKEPTATSPFENDVITLGELENLARHASDELRPQLKRTVNQAHQALLHDKTVQSNHRDSILNGELRQVPFKIKLVPKQQASSEEQLRLGSSKPRAKQTFEYQLRPLDSSELALLHAEKQRVQSTRPDLRADVEQLLTKHQQGLTFSQKQDIISQDHDQQVKFSLQTSQLGNLARRFTQLAQRQEDRDLLRGDSDQEYEFEPPQVPSMQDAWGVKNRTPERHQAATIAADQFVRQQRKFDKLVAEVQEVELLEKLSGGSIKIPDAIRNTSNHPYRELDDKRAKELLIKQGIKTKAEIELDELKQALAFERGMQHAIDANYGDARQQLKSKLQKMAREDNVTPQQFQIKANQGLLNAPSKKELEQDQMELLIDPTKFSQQGGSPRLQGKAQKRLSAQQIPPVDDIMYPEAQIVGGNNKKKSHKM
jgi:ribosomal protein RSM22 (predicted rRNA methylase)